MRPGLRAALALLGLASFRTPYAMVENIAIQPMTGSSIAKEGEFSETAGFPMRA